MTRFFIATSTLNAEHLIDETVVSVLSQAGSFSLHYHVQDAGSEDGTIDRLKHWSRRLKSGGFPILCAEVKFTFASQPDSGLYQGLNRAFRYLDGDDDDWMSWINAGDRIEAGALATVASVGERFPDAAWLNGLLAQCTSFGGLLMVGMTSPVNAQKTVAAGLHDGTHFGFIQQEGTFWRRALWHAAGGRLSDNLRLAGDYDLWRRFADHAAPLRVHGVLGIFRHHENRLVSDPGQYLAEVRRLVRTRDDPTRPKIWEQYQRLKEENDPSLMVEADFFGDRVVWDRKSADWRREQLPVGIRPRHQ